MMSDLNGGKITLRRARFGLLALFAVSAGAVYSQAVAPPNSLSNPYAGAPFGKLPEVAIGFDSGHRHRPRRKSVWVAERCGAFAPPSQVGRPGVQVGCDGSTLDPILKFDETGKLVKSFGAGLILFPHGLSVDPEGNVWVTDGLGKEGIGHQVFKFSPDGKLLLTLGKRGVAGSGADEFNAPSATLVAPNGDIFVADVTAATPMPASSSSTRPASSSRPGARRAAPPARSTARTRWRWTRAAGCSLATAATTASDLRSGRQLHRPMGAVQPPERRLHRQERCHLCCGFGVGSVNKTRADWKRGIRVGSAKTAR